MPTAPSATLLDRIQRGLAQPLGASVLILLSFGLFLWLLPRFYEINLMLLVAASLVPPLVLVAIMDARYVWYLGVLLMPMSLALDDYIPRLTITAPSDFVAIGLFLILLLKLPQNYRAYGRILGHPISLVLLLYLGWMLLCIPSSSIPFVSFKYWLSALFYCGAFFFFSAHLMEDKRELTRWITIPALTLSFVCLFTMAKHGAEGFTLHASYKIMRPFYKEHTAYAASLVVFVVGALLLALRGANRTTTRAWLWVYAGVVLAAVLTSFTRGAWLGLFAAAGGVLLLYFWRQLRIPLLLGGLFVAVFLVSKLSPDSDQDMQSRKSSSLSERMFSVSNTQTDISNRERFNRWAAAVRMIEERPWLGFGPGTYAMQYAPFQRSMNKTPISTNQGVQGTTHNELLLAGSEMGIPAMFIVLLIYATTLLVALRGFLRTPQRWKQTAYAIAAGGLITYYVHGLVNNFLDQDKVAIPVYLCMAMLVALDIYHRDDPTPTEFAQTKVRGRHPVT